MQQRSRLCGAISGTYLRLLLVCANALAATDLVFAGVLGLLNNAEAFLATEELVTRLLLDLPIAIFSFPATVRRQTARFPGLPHRVLDDQLRHLAGSQRP